MTTRNGSAVWKLATLALGVSLLGCATPSQPPESVSVISASPRLPAPDPRLMEAPPEPGTFSESVQRDLSRWADMLTGSPRK